MESRGVTFPGSWLVIALAVLSSACNGSSSSSPTSASIQTTTPPAQHPVTQTQPSPTPRTFSLHGHSWLVEDVALSASGHLALSGDDGGYLRLWDVETGKLLHVLAQTPDIEQVSLSADGHLALSSNYEGIRVWDTSTGELLRKFGHYEQGGFMYSVSVSLSADGNLALSAGGDGIMRIWDVAAGELLRSFDFGGQGLHQGDIDLSLSADGRFALSGDLRGTVLYWDTTTGNILHTLAHRGDQERYSPVVTALSADGRYALSGGHDGTARLWHLATGELLHAFDHNRHAPSLLAAARRRDPASDFQNWITHVALSGDGSRAISVASDGFLRLWNRSSDAPVRTFKPRGIVNGIALTSQGSMAMTGGYHNPYVTDHLDEGTAHVWDMTRDDPKWLANTADHLPRLYMDYKITPSSTDIGNYAMEVQFDGRFFIPGEDASSQEDASSWEEASSQEEASVRYQWELHGPAGDLAGSHEGRTWSALLTKAGLHTVQLTATKDNGTPLVREETLYLPDTKRPTAVISGLPESGLGPRYLDLDGLASADEDGEIVRIHWKISYIAGIDKQDSWSGVLHPGIHEIGLTVIDEDGARDTAKKTIYLEPDPDYYDVSIYNDNVIVLDLEVLDEYVYASIFGPSPIVSYSWAIYTHFEDAFDHLLFFSNSQEIPEYFSTDLGLLMPIQNRSKGIGTFPLDAARRIGSEERLLRILHFPYWFALDSGPVLHDFMHTWANHIIPTSFFGHFGFSSANGQTGGFDARHLKRAPQFDQDDGEAWVVSGSDVVDITLGRRQDGPYSPIELYLAGWIPIDEVPTLRAAPKAYPLEIPGTQGETSYDAPSEKAYVLDEDGNVVWIVPGWEEYTPARILEEFGPRIPPVGEARTEFRAAAILLTDKDHPATEERLKALSAQVAAFSHKGDDGADTTNFHEATGGRATITMDGLAALKKSVPALPRFKDSDP